MNNFKYSYLHKYKIENLARNEDNAIVIFPESNYFDPVNPDEIEQAEKLLGFNFPLALKEFWLEIGSGSLVTDINKNYSGLDNDILPPKSIANILLRKDESEDMLLPILPDVLDEFLEEGDIPFMEVGDSSSFLKMKKGSDEIYSMGERVKEENFERLIWRMYHESAKYYLYMGPFSQI